MQPTCLSSNFNSAEEEPLLSVIQNSAGQNPNKITMVPYLTKSYGMLNFWHVYPNNINEIIHVWISIAPGQVSSHPHDRMNMISYKRAYIFVVKFVLSSDLWYESPKDCFIRNGIF